MVPDCMDGLATQGRPPVLGRNILPGGAGLGHSGPTPFIPQSGTRIRSPLPRSCRQTPSPLRGEAGADIGVQDESAGCLRTGKRARRRGKGETFAHGQARTDATAGRADNNPRRTRTGNPQKAVRSKKHGGTARHAGEAQKRPVAESAGIDGRSLSAGAQGDPSSLLGNAPTGFPRCMSRGKSESRTPGIGHISVIDTLTRVNDSPENGTSRQ